MRIEKFEFEKFKNIILSNPKTKKLLFHCSPIPNLEELNPNLSSAYKHGTQKCVFASFHLHTILFYGSKKRFGNYDGAYGILNNGEAFFNEAYKDALKRVYKGEKCYIYIVDQENPHFEEGQTTYPAEVVDGTGNSVKVIKCYEVDDIYELLLKFHNANLIHLRYFENYNEEGKKYVYDYQKKIIRWLTDDEIINKSSYKAQFCYEHFPEAYAEIESEIKTNTL